MDYVLLPGRNLFLLLELNGVSTARAERAGQTVRNSGGHLLFLSPGIQYLPIPPLILEGSVQVPIYRDFNGRQLAPDYSVARSAISPNAIKTPWPAWICARSRS